MSGEWYGWQGDDLIIEVALDARGAAAELSRLRAENERLRADNERLHGAIAEIREMLGDGEVDDADIAECFLKWEV